MDEFSVDRRAGQGRTRERDKARALLDVPGERRMDVQVIPALFFGEQVGGVLGVATARIVSLGTRGATHQLPPRNGRLGSPRPPKLLGAVVGFILDLSPELEHS